MIRAIETFQQTNKRRHFLKWETFETVNTKLSSICISTFVFLTQAIISLFYHHKGNECILLSRQY
jgi:hypothetical protein